MKTLAIKEPIQFIPGVPVHVEFFHAGHYPAHFHPSTPELLLCLEGSATIRACNAQKDLHPGSTFSMDASDIHCIYSDDENLLMSLHIDPSQLELPPDAMTNCFLELDDATLSPLQIEPMYQVLDRMISLAYRLIAKDTEPCDVDTMRKQSNQLVDLLLRNFDWLSFIPDPYYTNRQFHERCKRIMAYCLENYTQKISISQVAEMEHINENYLSAFMKRTSLGGFKNSVNFIRCYYAEQLLLHTDDDVIDISSRCGFSDPKYFYAAFKSMWGNTPAKHRKWYREYASIRPDIRILDPVEAKAALDGFLPGYHQRKMTALMDVYPTR
ncbi:MAG: helix-turn-helix domain-containing protein [Bacillota bacterium]|nr:helix-turn-helix domain-containing protein [Bacillota bacterium]